MSPAVRGLAHGALLATARLRSRSVFVVGATLAISILVALVQRALGPVGALDRALATTASWILPLAAAGIVTSVLGLRTPRDFAWPAARYGASRLMVALGALGVIALAISLTSAVSSALVVFIAHSSGSRDAPLGSDAVTTAGVAALTGWVYAAALSFGASFGRRGGGRAIVLALDFVIGGAGVVGFLFPRGHGLNLLGVETAAISQRGSSIALVVLAVVWSGLAAFRSRD